MRLRRMWWMLRVKWRWEGNTKAILHLQSTHISPLYIPHVQGPLCYHQVWAWLAIQAVSKLWCHNPLVTSEVGVSSLPSGLYQLVRLSIHHTSGPFKGSLLRLNVLWTINLCLWLLMIQSDNVMFCFFSNYFTFILNVMLAARQRLSISSVAYIT